MSWRPAYVWAAFGALCLSTQIYVFARWMLSPGFHPTEPGPDPIPDHSRIAMIAFQVLSLSVGALVLLWFVRGIRSSGRIDAIRLMMLGWLSAYWLDPFLNFLTPIFTYNAYLVNYGSWAEFIPGWQSDQGARISEPLLVCIPNYFFNFTATAYSGLWMMRKAKARWPALGTAGLLLAAYIGIWFTMSLLDMAATRWMHFDAWPGTHQSLAFWGGRFFQFPAYELLLFPLVFALSALLLFHADEHGRTAIERGISVSHAGSSSRWRTALRVLAFVGFCNLMNLGYTTTMGVIGLSSDPWPKDMPSWLANQQCGEASGRPCQASSTAAGVH